jgi:uncharacterized DUF497 family protein
VGITYDPRKRQLTLAERGLDFEHAEKVFSGAALTLLDDREDYGEPRFQNLWIAWSQAGDGGVDPAWRGSPRYLNEEMQCP